jgi:two-component system sensor histidine kinase KdpD
MTATEEHSVAAAEGKLRVYLGAAPGSGKTFAMLREGHDRRGRGEDVVVAFVETHGRRLTREAIGTLEVVPRLHVDYQGHALQEMDLDAVIARHPQVALVDELAHTNAPGVKHPKRYQDVEDILAAGIDVITTVNVQHLDSVTDLVQQITGIPVRETLPDRVLDQADEIQFIDISPEALRKRMRHGNVYAKDRVDTALSNFFRPGNLAALREIALRLVGQNVGRTRSVVRLPPQDVLVAVSGSPNSGPLIRRAARIAKRFDGMCTVLCVVNDESDEVEGRAHAREVAEHLQCRYIERSGRIVDTVIATARELLVQHVVVGESERPTLSERLRRGLVDRLISDLPDVAVHIVARYTVSRPTAPQSAGRRPDSEALLRSLQASQSRAGLRVYLGYAPGCGTTMAMLDEARRRASRGTDVVVAAVSTRGTRTCEEVTRGLEVLGGMSSPATDGHVDVNALLRRNPDVACIDDLAGKDIEGRPITESIPRFLRNGMTIIATLHLTDLTSTRAALGDLVGPQTEPGVDDAVLDRATELEMVDVTPSVLDERLRDGEIVPASEAARARAGAYRPEVLAALRELAFKLIAEHTDRRLVAYMRDRGIETPWEVKPRVMLGVPPRPDMEPVIATTLDLTDRLDGRLTAVTVHDTRRSDEERQLLGSYAALVHQGAADFVTLEARNPAKALAAYARTMLATTVVLTRGRGSRGTLRALIRILSDVDIHVLPAPHATQAAGAAGAASTAGAGSTAGAAGSVKANTVPRP